MRIQSHPILGEIENKNKVTIWVDGKPLQAIEGEPIAAALMANEIDVFRKTQKHNEPRGIYCGIGRCTDCAMIVNGIPNTRTCVTPVKEGMIIERQHGVGKWRNENEG